MPERKTLVHRVSILVNYELSVVHYQAIPEKEVNLSHTLGKHPWEFAHPDWQEKIKQSFELCLSTKEPQFHVGRLGSQSPDYPDQYLCAWLWPVAPSYNCGHQCVAIRCDTILVPPKTALLSPRERKILAMIGKGRTPTSIATEFDVSPTTIYTHLWRVKSKLELDDQLQVAVWAALHRDILSLGRDVFREATGKEKYQKKGKKHE